MNLAVWMDQQRPAWKRLEHLLEQIENNGLGSLEDAAAVEFARLYRRTASDLNQAQSFVQADGVVKYLNDLVARCYVAINARIRFDGRGWLRRLVWEYPAHFRRHFKAFLLATAIFAVGGVFGYVASAYDSLAARSLLLPNMPMIQPGQEGSLASTGQLAGFSGFLFTNNTRVCLIVCALGLTWGVGTALLLWYNGLMMGALAAVFGEAGAWREFCTGILPHGVLEIPAMLISGAAGFLLAGAMLRARPWPRLEELRRQGLEALWLLAGCFPLMGVAALLEAGVARAPDWYLDSGFKLMVAGMFGLLFVVYVALFGWGVRVKEES
jgi:uncharacterized membrane protein SpoIIM required for sporulation